MTQPNLADQPTESTFLKNDLPINEKLERARMELLDLSARNKLLNIPRNSKTSRTITIIDEKSEEIFRMLVTESKTFTFLPGRASAQAKQEEDEEEIVELANPDESIDEQGRAKRHIDNKLQTRLTTKGLQKRLLDLCLDAQTLEEEQGVNILYMGLGTLKWIDPTTKNIRFAPLILIPVRLERGNAAEQFKLKWRQEDPATNLSLEVFLERVHSLKMPEVAMDEDFNIRAYFSAVAQVVQSKANWEVNSDDIVLGFFSFAKFLMFVDLDAAVWPLDQKLTTQPLIRGLLADGFADDGALIADDANIDPHIAPADMRHIVDCDSSQSLAVHDVRQGRNLIVQGPPGTGKSQTIANIIAAAIADGKTVLFVAEKMAALEVVKRRLDQVGVGDACLELHSNKANKRMVLDELRRTSELGSPKGQFPTSLNQRIQTARDLLNAHATRMHEYHPHANLTPYQVIGQLTRLRQDGVMPNAITFTRPELWSADETKLRLQLVGELAQRITETGLPANHPWRGIGITSIISTEVTRLMVQIGQLQAHAVQIEGDQTALAQALGVPVPSRLSDFATVVTIAERVAPAPSLSAKAMTAQIWNNDHSSITNLLKHGKTYQHYVTTLSETVSAAAWTSDITELLGLFTVLPASFASTHFQTTQKLHAQLPKLLRLAHQLAQDLGNARPLDNIAAIKRAITTGERVACAPNVSADVFAATIWDNGVEQAADLAEAVKTFEQEKRGLLDQVTEAAWDIDLAPARQELAMHGASWLRFFRADWRNANKLVRSLLKNPELALTEQITILDRLICAQKARAVILQNDAFGRIAFGEDWRAEHSKAAPLFAIVEWMRSLRGLGAEPRLIASRLPDRPAIGERVKQVSAMLDELLPLLSELWHELGCARETFFADCPHPEQLSLHVLTAEVDKLVRLYQQGASLIPTMPPVAEQVLAILSDLTTGQQALRQILANYDQGRDAFDDQWQGPDSDWQALSSAAEWMTTNLDIREVAARHPDKAQPLHAANAVQASIAQLIEGVDKLFFDLCSNSENLFGVAQTGYISITRLLERFSLWLEQEEQLSKWVTYRDRA
ncbi:MAG: DUF4011 domain-containing protein, partial [Burkholderiales bacterium]|nr:DUF4011 domain-containing protein [Burkholderiales bacterium]